MVRGSMGWNRVRKLTEVQVIMDNVQYCEILDLFEKWSFLLCSRIKPTFFQCISDCLWCDMAGDNANNELSSLNCIFKLPRLDLANN